MSETWLLIPGSLLLAACGCALIILLPRSVLLSAVILVRSVADVGTSSETGTLLPNTLINATVAIVAILACLTPSKIVISRRTLGAGISAAAALIFWTAVSLSYFRSSIDYVGECFRALSLIAVLILAYRVGVEGKARFDRIINLVVGIPACVLLIGYVAGFGPMLNPAGRATGTFAHANQAAAFFAVGVIACIWSFWGSRRKISLVVAVLSLVAVMLTQSLGALAAVAAGGIVLLCMNSNIPAGRRVFYLIAGLSAVILLFLSIGASGRIAELEGVNYGDAESDNSLDWRFVNWQILVPIWWERAPLLGLGFGSTQFDIRPLGQAPHSVLVQVLVETGVTGLVLTSLLAVAFMKAIRRRYYEHPGTAAALAGIGVTIFTHALASNWLTYAAALYLALFIVGALLGRSGESSLVGRDQMSRDAYGSPWSPRFSTAAQ